MATPQPASTGPNLVPIIIAAVFTPIAILSVALRFYSRHLKHAPLLMDDWIILPALLFAVGQAVILVLNACLGDLGQHQPLDANGFAIPSPKLTVFQELEYASFVTFVLALLFTKLSVLHLYNRVFQVQRPFRIAILVTYALNVAWGIAFLVGYIFKCFPIQQYWTTLNGQGHCLPSTLHYAFAISNVVLDFIILVMPLPVVWSLNMAWRQKLAVSGIFLLGSIVVVLSITKAIAFFTTLEWVAHDQDILFDEAPLFYFSVPEALMAVTSACLPTLRPLFRKMSMPLSGPMSHTANSASVVIGHVRSGVELSARRPPSRYAQARQQASDDDADDLLAHKPLPPPPSPSAYSRSASWNEPLALDVHNLPPPPSPTSTKAASSPLERIARQASRVGEMPDGDAWRSSWEYPSPVLPAELPRPAPSWSQRASQAGSVRAGRGHVREASEEVIIAIPHDIHNYW